VEHWHRICILSDQQQGSPAGGSADHTIQVQQQPGSPGVRHVLETSQVVPVPDQGQADGMQGGSPMYQKKNDLPDPTRADVIVLPNA
jgi:hypothetical protein